MNGFKQCEYNHPLLLPTCKQVMELICLLLATFLNWPILLSATPILLPAKNFGCQATASKYIWNTVVSVIHDLGGNRCPLY